jgi:hypothetical protein
MTHTVVKKKTEKYWMRRSKNQEVMCFASRLQELENGCDVLCLHRGVGKRTRYAAGETASDAKEMVREFITRFVQNHVRAIMLKQLQCKSRTTDFMGTGYAGTL